MTVAGRQANGDDADWSRTLADIACRWSRASSPLRPAAIAELYTHDALFFGGLPDLYVGREGVAAYFSHYRDILSSIDLKLKGDHILPQSPEAFIFQGFAEFTFGLPDGRETFATLRATLGLVRTAGIWLIRLHHFSPPPERPPLPL